MTPRPLMITLALLASTGTLAADFGQLYRDTVTAWQAGDMETARGHMLEAAELRPDFPDVLRSLALIEARLGDTETAMGHLQRIADLGYSLSVESALFDPLREVSGFDEVAARLAENAEPRGAATTLFSLSLGPFIPEGIVWDATRQRIYLGSIRDGRVLAVDTDGDHRVLVPQGQLWAVFGMRLDPDTGMLWLATNRAEPNYVGPRPGSGSEIVVIDPAVGAVVRRYPFPLDGEHWLGDLILDGDGRVYTTDSVGGAYQLDPGSGDYRELLAPGVLVSPQGLALSDDGSALLVADYRGGLTRIDLGDGGHEPVAAPADSTLYGIDGLIARGATLIAVINGSSPHRVVELELDPEGRRILASRVLLSADPRFDEPTMITGYGDSVCLVADSHWNRFDAEGGLPPAAELSGPTVLCLDP